MEAIKVTVGDERFDQLVHGSESDPVLPQHGTADGELEVAAKARCMTSGAAGVVISFYTVLPDGRAHRVQAVTSRAAFIAAAEVVRNHPDLQ